MFNPFEEEDRNYEVNARYDYVREAYGQPCSCGTLTWGGDCPNCTPLDEEAEGGPHNGVIEVTAVEAAQIFLSDDDIPF